jgi:hypothetical protein
MQDVIPSHRAKMVKKYSEKKLNFTQMTLSSETLDLICVKNIHNC